MNMYFKARVFSIFLVLTLLLGALGLPTHVVQAAVALDSSVGPTPVVESVSATPGTVSNGNSITFSHTTGSGNNRLLLVGISFYHASSARTVSSVTFGGTSMNSVGTIYNGNGRRVAIYSLVGPAASTTANVVVTFSGTGVYGVASAVSFAGVDQCTPLGTFLGATGSSSTASVSPTSVAGDLVFDTVAAGYALTVGASQTQQWNTSAGTTIYGAASTEVAAGVTTTMSWGLGTSGTWAIGAVAVKPVSTAPHVYTTTSATTFSFCHTTGTGTNRLLMVGVSWNANTNNSPISSVTFSPSGGSAISLTQAISLQNSWAYRFAAIYYLVNPPSGIGGNVSVTFSASVGSGIVAGAANYLDVDQTTPLGAGNGADGVSPSASVTLSGLVGDELIFDTLFVGGSSTGVTAGTNQTELTGWDANASQARGAASTKPAPAGSTAMTWTIAGSQTSYIWVDVAVPINPTCTGGRHTLTVNNDGNGTVTLNPPGGSYCHGRSVTLTPVPNTNYFFSGWTGTDAGDVVNTNGVYTIVMDGDKTISANFVAQSCFDVSLTVADDTYLNSAATTTNYGNATTLQVDGSTDRTALLRWNMSSIPPNAYINSASIVLNVTDTSTTAYSLYDVAKPWVEGNGTSGSGATWATYDGSVEWGSAGAQQTTGNIDRGSTNLWSSTTSSFNSIGLSTVSLNSSGLTVVRRWVTGGSNNGVIIQDYSGSSLYFDSSEGATPPRLDLNYCVAQNLIIDASAGSNGSISPSGSVSVTANANQTFTISPNAPYVVADVLVDGVSVGYVTSYTFNNVNAPHTIYAWFVLPSAVTVTSFTGTAHLQMVELDWETANEQGLVGFNILRSESPDGTKVQQNLTLIPPQNLGQTGGAAYQFTQTASPGRSYYYWIELVYPSGSVLTEPVMITLDHLFHIPLLLR